MKNKSLTTASLGLLLISVFTANADAQSRHAPPLDVFAAPSTTVDVTAKTTDGKCLTAKLKLTGVPTTDKKPETVLQALWDNAISGHSFLTIVENWPTLDSYRTAKEEAMKQLAPDLAGSKESNVFLKNERPNIEIVEQAIPNTNIKTQMIANPSACTKPLPSQ